MKTLEILNCEIATGNIMLSTGYMLGVVEDREKAVKVQYLGRDLWFPKSAFQPKKFGDMYVFGVKQWFSNKIYNELRC